MVKRVQSAPYAEDNYASFDGQSYSNGQYYPQFQEQQDSSQYSNHFSEPVQQNGSSFTNSDNWGNVYNNTANYQDQGASYANPDTASAAYGYGADYAQDNYQSAFANQPVHSTPVMANPVQRQLSFGKAEVSWVSAFGTGGFPGELPLLEELGINFSHIKAKTIASINPFRALDAGTLADTDLTGPLLLCFIFGTSLLLTGKIHFGYIYGVATLGWLSIYTILNLMAEGGVGFYLTASILGYCLLPMVLLSATAILLQLRGFVGMVLGVASVGWCTLSASTLFVASFGMQNQQILIAYPILLFYSCFALMTIF